MAVKVRLKRMGRRHRAVYRLVAIEGRNQRDGKVIEELGAYDPQNKDQTQQLKLDRERIEYWLGVGAEPSETVASLLGKSGISIAKARKAKAASGQ